MVVDLREFEEFPVTIDLTAAPGEIEPFALDVLRVGEVVLRLSIQKSGDEYFCQGTVRASTELCCSRCAIEYQSDLEGKTDFIIRSDSAKDPEAAGIPDDEDYVLTHGNDVLADVTDTVRQTLVLALDMKPLCRPDCKGLCPVCKTNWNEKTCDCARESSDGRWDVLKGLLRN
jgi:uncharacterized protein